MADSENALIGRARKGDEKAFAQLVSNYRDRLYSIASSVCSSMPSEAEDVAQETFISAMKHISSFKANAAFSTWLYRIAANNCWQRMRGGKASRMAELPADTSKSHPRQPSAAENAIKDELSRAVNEALSELPAEYRMAVTLCDIEGLPNAEAAGKLGLSLPALKSRLHRGRALMKKQLEHFRRH
ncbi:MAG: sigma-70 family RNA polymerase sigma factor [Elusimicrobia bacterium]|nr:sigma-70 family RNA polymerase sigma factor [Elusimicrobiota bacterium]